jgi:hypothetical protein
MAIFQNNDSSIDLISFIYILENFSNKNLNIHDLCNNIRSKATAVLDMAKKVIPLMMDKKTKSKINRLTKLLFQSIPHSEEPTLQTSNINQTNQ